MVAFFTPVVPAGRPRGRPEGAFFSWGAMPFLGGRPRPRFTGASPAVAAAASVVPFSLAAAPRAGLVGAIAIIGVGIGKE